MEPSATSADPLAAVLRHPVLQSHIVAASKPRPDGLGIDGALYGLLRSDLEAISKSLPGLQLVVPVRETRRDVRFGEHVADVQLIGTVAEYAQLHQVPLVRGRFLTEEDDAELRNVAIIGEHVAQTLFQEDDSIGQSIRIGGHYFLVIGRIKSSTDGHKGGPDPASQVFVPIAAMRSRLGDREIVRASGAIRVDHFELSRIELLVQNPEMAQTTATALERLLKSLHDDDCFSVTLSNQNPTAAKE